LFQQIENAGGIWPALANGMIQERVARVRAERQDAVAHRTAILTGTNEFANLHEMPAAVLDVAPRALADDGPAAVTAQALPRIRLGEPYERLRESSDKILARSGQRPKIFLVPLGTPADFTPRAAFAKNFFEAGGIEVAMEKNGDRPARPADHPDAALICLCSSDKIYETEAAAAAGMLAVGGARRIYLAGRPGKMEAELRAAGVHAFVYEGCDALATLAGAYDILDNRITKPR
jgi:methylmalonyl-CoA mutase